MFSTPQGIPNLPDLTHPNELIQFGTQGLTIFLILTLLIGALGIVFAGISLALRRDVNDTRLWTQQWLTRYDFMLQILQHGGLILVLLVVGFFFSSTLANRYHHWEQAKVVEVARTVGGDRMEQSAPQMRYEIPQTFTYQNYIDGRFVTVEEIRQVDRFMTLAGSQVQVTLNQESDRATNRTIYRVDFSADYQVVNRLNETEDFFFEVRPPSGYSLLQNFRVERDGTRLEPINPGDYGFPFRLEPGETSTFRVAYLAQGSPRWVYNANGQLLSNFRLNAIAYFPKADFASGIAPTETQAEGRGTRFTWTFDDNVSVQNPFGVFTATNPVRNTGILPRLLLLGPALFLWWLLLLYLSVPIRLQDVAIAGGVFFASLLALTYLSRLLPASIAWVGVSLVLLFLAWGLGFSRQQSWAAIIATLAGAVIPVFGLLIPYSGLTLSFAGLLSAVWLAVRHWYGWMGIRRRVA
ncbi:hypothetical protein BH720_025465 [Desertifilum tharense IPPAS B-1220]|uniref:Uncharacterized protein n=1 Tax=Desertifilum tharense IPPAS B-1220 TaxID=1781255 RepID=A0A1E5QFJ8_9CYAN|nr:hypothetical protein [Desertifilum tharense]OEJ73452.1 hypothetical protein BH720_19675 [Desertifilum tharense IPPAS B-1220]